MVWGVTWGELAGIRPLWPTDAALMRRFMADPEVAHLLYEEEGSIPPSTLALSGMIFMNLLNAQHDYGIVERSGRLIGSVRLWRISPQNKSASLTIFIGEKSHWGKGYGTDALRLILHRAFGPLRLNRVELNVFDFNQRAIRSYEKAGFTLEGARRDALCRKGRFSDILVMGVLKAEFFAREAERKAARQAAEQAGRE